MAKLEALAFKRAVESVGGAAAAAGIVGCSRQNIHQLLERHSACPAGYVRLLSDASGVRRSQLRPDIYPEADEPSGPPPGWGKRSDPGISAEELEAAGQLNLLEGAEPDDPAAVPAAVEDQRLRRYGVAPPPEGKSE